MAYKDKHELKSFSTQDSVNIPLTYVQLQTVIYLLNWFFNSISEFNCTLEL